MGSRQSKLRERNSKKVCLTFDRKGLKLFLKLSFVKCKTKQEK
ncbi:hypothetical protein NEOC65_001601 [Neochlamydia sp. AcF65]|nr:hypothetical protein [Neochlamydia sp. AcF65]